MQVSGVTRTMIETRLVRDAGTSFTQALSASKRDYPQVHSQAASSSDLLVIGG